MNYFNENIMRIIGEFNKKINFPIFNVSVEYNDSIVECYIDYLDDKNEEQVYYSSFDNLSKISDENIDISENELKIIEKIFSKKYGLQYEIQGIKKYKDPHLYVIIYKDFSGNSMLAIYDREKRQFSDFLNYQKYISFETLSLYLQFNNWYQLYFYHEGSYSNINGQKMACYAINKAMDNYGIVPSNFDELYESDGDLDYKTLWDSGKLYPDVDLRVVDNFRCLFTERSQYSYGDGFECEEIFRKIRRKQYNLIREKHKVKNLDFNNETKFIHYVYSTLKVYKEQLNTEKVKISIEKITKICGQMKSKQMRDILDYLVENHKVSISKASQGYYYNVLE